MGVERAVTRWYIKRQSLLNEIAVLEARLASQTAIDDAGTTIQQDKAEAAQQLAKAQEKLRTLGQCPRPMMG